MDPSICTLIALDVNAYAVACSFYAPLLGRIYLAISSALACSPVDVSSWLLVEPSIIVFAYFAIIHALLLLLVFCSPAPCAQTLHLAAKNS